MSNYWIRRAERQLVAREITGAEYEKRLRRAYQRELREIQKDLEAFYGRYAEDQEITLAEAERRLTTKELKSYREEHGDYISQIGKLVSDTYKHNLLSGVGDDILKSLKKASARAYVTRLDELKARITHRVNTLGLEQEAGMTELMRDGYEDTFYETMFESSQRGLAAEFNTPSRKILDKAVKENWMGSNYSSRIWDDKAKLLREMDKLIGQHLVTGGRQESLAQKLAERMNVSLSSAQRLVRTELNHITNKARMDSYKEAGVEYFEFVATLDQKTSEICRHMDGEIIPVKHAQPGVNMPSLHPYCRSTTVPHFPEDEESFVEARVARDEQGRTYIIDNIRYEDWVQEKAAPHFADKVKKLLAKYSKDGVLVDSLGHLFGPKYEAGAHVKQSPKTLINFRQHSKLYEDEVRSFTLQHGDTPEALDSYLEALKDYLDEGELAMRIPDTSVLKKILGSKFKNQFETGTSKGYLGEDTRKRQALLMFGLKRSDIDNMLNGDFEKYGYLASKDPEDDFKHIPVSQYGDIIIKFKKETVAYRTTYTIGDSLGVGQIVPGKYDDPSLSGVALVDLERFRKDTKKFTYLNNLFRDDYKSFGRKSRELGTHNLPYVELQYHGELTPDDIKSITFKRSEVKMTETLIKEIEDMGIEVEIIEDEEEEYILVDL